MYRWYFFSYVLAIIAFLIITATTVVLTNDPYFGPTVANLSESLVTKTQDPFLLLVYRYLRGFRQEAGALQKLKMITSK